LTGQIRIRGSNNAVIGKLLPYPFLTFSQTIICIFFDPPGVVPQHDELLANLSVRESMMFSAKLRYGLTNDNEELVKKTIKMFNLGTCADTFVQRCSGGQRKRLSIALEMIARPNILILDEPTTGLDAPSCSQVIKLMIQMATTGE
jgi:ABC-type multidrug transport system ATPase subunit